ncbi:MAG TPA: hypothetical protein ENH09_02960 [Bacteroidetes bacterium]|nr:hypothetical protein [Bacteroidota bacterium]
MKTVNAFVEGLKLVLRYRKYWFLLYGFNLLFALIAAYPFRILVRRYFGHSLSAGAFLTQFDFMALTNFLKDNAPALSVMTALLVVIGLFYWIFQYFFAGGLYYLFLNEDAPKDLPNFWKMAAIYFGRFMRILLIGVILWIVVLFIYFGLLEGLSVIKKHLFNEIFSSLLRGGILAIVLVIILFFNMLLDYTKTFLVLDEQSSVLKSFLKAIGFVFKHSLNTLSLYYLVSLAGAFLIVSYLLGSTFFNGEQAVSLLILFGIQQILIFLKIGLRLEFYASQIALVKMTRWPFSYF